jgi:chloramphenicol O-acetyltransferase type A
MPDETFCNCRTDCRKSLEEFLVYGKQRQEEAMMHHGFNMTQEDETNLIFASCVPWVAFTQVIQPTPIPADCNPRIVFGKYIKEGDKVLMPLHIQCNHALVDGRHVGKFFAAFEELANSVE